MPKDSTKDIQNSIRELGERLGFVSKIEERIHSTDEFYAPIYDAVWYLDLEKFFDFSGISRLFKYDEALFERIKMLPFAGFEIEGAATTSKNQISNFANLYSGNFLYNFVVVNNAEANGEDDTYRRGVKIKRYFAENSGDRNVIFFDKVHLDESIKNLTCFDNNISTFCSSAIDRGKWGGETTSIPIYERLRPLMENSGLDIRQNYPPWICEVRQSLLKELADNNELANIFLGQAYYKQPKDTETIVVKKLNEALYVPRIDVCMGFNAPKGFQEWMAALADTLQDGYINFPVLFALKRRLIENLFVPLIGIEIESSINKHLNGGIFNLVKNSYAGVVITKDPAEKTLKHIGFFKKELGLKDVTAACLIEE